MWRIFYFPRMDAVYQVENLQSIDIDAQLRRFNLFIDIARGKAQPWHRQIDDYERDYFMVNSGDTTPNKLDRDLSRLSDLGDMVEAAKAILMRSGWKLFVDRPGDNEVDKKKAGMVERYLKDIFRQIEERTGYDVEMRMVDFQARLSAAVLHWAYNPNPVIEAFEYAPPLHLIPIDMWVIDPRNFFPVKGGPYGDFEFVVHIEKRSLSSVMQMLDGFQDSGMAAAQIDKHFGMVLPENWYTTEADLYDYWGWHKIDGKYRVVNAIMYGRALIRPFQLMEGYDRLPWDIAPARDTGHKDLEKCYLPLTFHAKSHVRHSEKMQGFMDRAIEKAVVAPFVVELDQNQPEPPDIRSGQEFFITLKPGQKLNPPMMSGVPQDVFRGMELDSQRMQKSGFPNGVFGLSGPASGMNSGYGYEQQQEGGVLKITEPAEWLQRALQTFFRSVCTLIARHNPQMPVVVNYATGQPQTELTAADLLGWNIDVKWRSELPGDRLRKLAMATQAVGAELTSRETAREMYLDLDDPQRESELILQEKVLLSHPDLAKAKAFELLVQRNALPNFGVAAQAQLQMKVQQVVARLQATGAPPQIIQQAIQRVIEQEHMMLMAQYMMMPPMGGAPQGADAPQPNAPAQSTPKNLEPQMGMVGPGRNGQPPAGNPADPQRDIRGMLNNG
jgi:hypothetical protein